MAARMKSGILAAVDQGLSSLTTFAISIALARLLPISEFASFNFYFSLILLAALVQNAFVVEPLLYFGSIEAPSPKGRIWGSFRGPNALVLSSGALLLLVVAVAANGWDAALGDGLAAIVGLVGYLSLMFFRRVTYLAGAIGRAVMAGLISLFIAVILLLGLKELGLLSLQSALLSLGAANGAGSLSIALATERKGPTSLRSSDLVRDNWAYGKWLLASACLAWLPTNFYFFALPLLGSSIEAGALRALLLVVMPIQLGMANMNYLLLPRFAERASSGYSLVRPMAKWTAILGGVAAVYALALVPTSSHIVRLVLGAEYVRYSHLIPLLALVPTVGALQMTLIAGLKARRRTWAVFVAYLVPAPFAIVGVVLVSIGGISVAPWTIFCTYAASAATAAMAHARTARSKPADGVVQGVNA